MWPYADLCNLLFQAVDKANHFKDVKIYYFHNCFYDRVYTTPACEEAQSVGTQWVLNNLHSDYKVIVVGDASMAPAELLRVGGSSDYNSYNEEPGIVWVRRLTKKYEKMIWFNPLPENSWEFGFAAGPSAY